MLLPRGQRFSRYVQRSARRLATRWALLLVLPLVGLMLGLAMPAATEIEFGQRDGGPPRLLANEFHDTWSTLWLVSADDLDGSRTRLADVPHAPGWDVEAATAPDRSVAAVLSLPPGSWDAKTQAALDLVTERGARRLATGLDLTGGVVWSDDGAHLLARRGNSLLALGADSGEELGRWSPPGVSGPYGVAMRDDRIWAVTIDAWGSTLSELALTNGRVAVLSRTRIADGATRDWALSADGSLLAFGVQRGIDLSVRVAALGDRQPEGELLLSSASGSAARMAVPEIAAGDGIPNSAAPVWRSDGGLQFGSWHDAGDEDGFVLPLSWDAGGDWLAVRSFSGSGPGDPGEERAAVQRPDGSLSTSKDGNLRLFGWWHE